MNPTDFTTPPNHTGFRAKRLFGTAGEIGEVAVAHLEPGGGGPISVHTHPHDHLFIVTQGEVRIQLGEEEKILSENEAFLVRGEIPHAVWNRTDKIAVMIGITVKNRL